MLQIAGGILLAVGILFLAKLFFGNIKIAMALALALAFVLIMGFGFAGL